MRIPRIYVPINLQEGEIFLLDERNRHYLLNVMRLKSNSEIVVFNGLGGEYCAAISSTGKKASVCIQQFINIERESPLNLHLGQGLSKGERMDYTLQKATEMGVTTITPVQTARSVVRIRSKDSAKRMTHWQGVLISTCEQTGRTRLPILQPPIPLSEFITNPEKQRNYYIFDTEGKTDFKSSLEQDKNKQYTFLIGPEGGLDESEFVLAESHGYKRVRLGPRILRTETAGPIALAITQYEKGDLSKC